MGLNLAEALKEVSEIPKDTKDIDITKENAIEILQGFFSATQVGDFDVLALLECIYEVDQTLFYLDEAIHFTKTAIQEKFWMPLVGAAIAMFDSYGNAKGAIHFCSTIDADWTHLDSIKQ